MAVAGTVAVGLAGAAGASGGAVANHTVYAVDAGGGIICFSTVQNSCPGGSVPVDVNISGAGAGDTVVFDFSDMYTSDHNAASRGTNWTFTTGAASNPHTPNPDRRNFTQNGDYEFVCDVHAGLMQGTIHVTGGTSGTPSATATSTPTPTPTVTTPPPDPEPDAVRPTLRRVDATGSRHAVKVSFRLSESATVTIRVRRGSRIVKTVTRQVAAGNRSVSVRSSKLRKGRYKIEVRARDASGNVSTRASESVRIRR